MTQFIDTLVGIFQSSGFARFGEPGGWLYAIMICVGCFLLYLAIVKEFEPLILLPMAFGMILANLPGRFARIMPNAMGSRIRGSNSFTMARYSKKQPTQIMIAYR